MTDIPGTIQLAILVGLIGVLAHHGLTILVALIIVFFLAIIVGGKFHPLESGSPGTDFTIAASGIDFVIRRLPAISHINKAALFYW